jgi:cytochrome c nitrite reductase small subunit
MMPLDIRHQIAQEALIVASITILSLQPSLVLAEAGSQAIQEVGLLRGLGIASAVVGIIVLVLTQHVYRNKITRGTYHWLLLLALFVLPLTATLSTTATVMEGTKSVQACASCHVMHPFVNDLKDPSSPTLAARHYRHNWIARDQCYACHVTYGATGTLAGKRDGFRHWVYYITNTYSDPIKYAGSYENSNCLACHGQTTKWMQVKSHQALAEEFTTDRIACTRCHGPPHPLPSQRRLSASKP